LVVKVGFVGCGGIAHTHVDRLRKVSLPPTEVGASSVRLGLYASSHICRFGGSRLPHPIELITLWAIDAPNLKADALSSATCHAARL